MATARRTLLGFALVLFLAVAVARRGGGRGRRGRGRPHIEFGSIPRLTRSCFQCFELDCPGTNDALFDDVLDFTLDHLRKNYYFTEKRHPEPCPEDVNDGNSWAVVQTSASSCPRDLVRYPTCGAGRFKVKVKSKLRGGDDVTCHGRICGCATEGLLKAVDSNVKIWKNATVYGKWTNSVLYYSMQMVGVTTCDADNYCVKDVDGFKRNSINFGLGIVIVAGVVVVIFLFAVIGICVLHCKKVNKQSDPAPS